MPENIADAVAMEYLEEVFADVYAGIRRGRTRTDCAGEILRGKQTEVEDIRRNHRTTLTMKESPGQKFLFAGEKAKGINVESTETERYEILKDVRFAPAKIDYAKLQGIDLENYATRKISSVKKGMCQVNIGKIFIGEILRSVLSL